MLNTKSHKAKHMCRGRAIKRSFHLGGKKNEKDSNEKQKPIFNVMKHDHPKVLKSMDLLKRCKY